ncbi:hypothetical protein [Phytohabitans kaempferiae]|uniref:SnoaL-like domain-containing protein n=1 Tax=Phytohabitans kaempferiae TaxID=1620943 RepID=A0ABV6M9F1_9ACTN
MWTTYARAGATADPHAPDLERYATGLALTTLRNGLAGYRKRGQRLKGNLITSPRVHSASPSHDPSTVTVADCMDTSDFLVYRSDGRLADDEPGGRRAALATVVHGPAGWRVASFGIQEVGSC